MDNSEGIQQIVKNHFIEKSLPTPDPTTLYQFSNKFDWILLTEGWDDISFYIKFTTTFRRIKHNSIKNEFRNDVNEVLEDIKKKDCRKKIIRLIEEKKKDPETKHFYGIIDRDYRREQISDSIKQNLKITDAHSLEALILKYAGIEKFSAIVSRCYSSFSLEQIKKVLLKAIDFSFLIGILRKFRPNGPKYKELQKNYSQYITFDSIYFNFNFDFTSYIKDLISFSSLKVSPEKLLNEVLNGPITSHNEYYICQGHDIVEFINALFSSINKDENQRKLLTKHLINNFDKTWFYSSEIYNWLQDIEKEKQNEKKSLTDPKYRDYIISVG